MLRTSIWKVWILVSTCLGLTGCISAYKQVVIRTSDERTGEPIPGVQIATDYGWHESLRGSRVPSRTITDNRGIAILSVNVLPEKRILFGLITLEAFYPMISLSISNDIDQEQIVRSWTPEPSIFGRPPKFVPDTPDIEFSIPSVAEVLRQKAQKAEEQRAEEAAIDALIRQRPDYWPQETRGSESMTNGFFAYSFYMRRWDLASKIPMGSDTDLSEIRKAVLGNLLSNPKVGEIRWVSSTTVMAEGSWYSGNVGAGYYFYVLRKEGEKWQIIARFRLLIS